ncbi:hypothetical protein NYP18_02540 [Corynebacterium sp. YIM 101645]|uniref:DUF4303 domain-containing protein n=1 Tax=Corynebacterium lemuris TaxID=1859292 RepID=A0ABT2FTS9_9CORY|nr:hypothetical protein [Corynebacterium lemuris]MCS5478526.1 hypothetical protein [Corynebacterium lemuris]
MTVPHTIESFRTLLTSALVETIHRNSEHLRGEKIYGATLVPDPGNLSPWFGVLDDTDTIGMTPCQRWTPDDFCQPLHTPRLAEVCALTRELHEAWAGTDEEWHRASLSAFSGALGADPVRRALGTLGADPILYIFHDTECGIEPTTFAALNVGRESEPFYRQAAQFLL